VGGVSAGGLEALQSLLAVIPEDFSLALVIVQHHCCPVNYHMKSNSYIFNSGPTCNFGKMSTS
jgi:chemotaxis response regulator CheB